ncbi:coil containing protein [Vibrio phage 1.137.O._10N.261.46.B5]|nr:hypothetical protein NVP1127O_09 [Vibrio phage 1.127.O._10N.286.52.E12]AUR90063.1 coil containing protein [Vibrio phage 1.137.O._10N.261.46.B5]
MKNADLPAMPLVNENGAPHFACDLAMTDSNCTGLTKREMFAMNAMQGILSNSGGVIQGNNHTGTGWCNSNAKDLARWSLECADALLKELES